MWSCASAHTCNRDPTRVWGRWGGGSGTLNLLRGKKGFSAALMKCTAHQHSTTLELFKTVHPRNTRSCRAVPTSPANPRAGQSRAEQPLSFGRGHGASRIPKTRITQLQTATPPAKLRCLEEGEGRDGGTRALALPGGLRIPAAPGDFLASPSGQTCPCVCPQGEGDPAAPSHSKRAIILLPTRTGLQF